MPVTSVNIIGMTDEVIDVTISLDAEVVKELRRAVRERANYADDSLNDFLDYASVDAVFDAVARALAEQHPEAPTYKVGDLIDLAATPIGES